MHVSRILAFGFAVAIVAVAAPAQAGLIGYYTFEGNADDVSGNGRHGTLSGTAPTLTGAGGGYTGWGDAGSQAYQFGAGGANTFVTVPIDINPSVLPQVTFGAWVKASDLTDVIRGIISHDDGNFDRTLDMDTRGGNPTTPEWCLFTAQGGGGYCGAAVTTEWTFLVARYDAALGTAQLTINGMHSGLLASTNGPSVVTTTTIGRNPNFDLPFVGLIDNAFFFDHYLTNNEVDAIYRNGINVPEPSSMTLLGLAGLALARRLRRRHAQATSGRR